MNSENILSTIVDWTIKLACLHEKIQSDNNNNNKYRNMDCVLYDSGARCGGSDQVQGKSNCFAIKFYTQNELN